jgi:hypothetical protein
MNKKKYKNQDLLDRIDKGVRAGIAYALAEHKKAGRSIVVQHNGKIVEIPAEQI